MAARSVLLSTCVATAVLVASVTLAGCATPPAGSTATAEPSATVSPSTPSAAPTSIATAKPHGKPTLSPDGTAYDNRAFFDATLTPVAEADQKSPSHAMVDALAAAGFDPAAMQVTADTSKTGLDADSVIVSVEMGGLCLIGQRTVDKLYFSSVEPALKSGGCLIGETEKIDWVHNG